MASRGHVDQRPAARPAPPGGEYLRAGRARRGHHRGGGAGPPTPRGGLCSATETPALPPTRRGGDCPSSPPLPAAPLSCRWAQAPRWTLHWPVRAGPALRRAEHSRGGAGTRPPRAVLPLERWVPMSGSHWRGPYPTTRIPAARGSVGQGARVRPEDLGPPAVGGRLAFSCPVSGGRARPR